MFAATNGSPRRDRLDDRQEPLEDGELSGNVDEAEGGDRAHAGDLYPGVGRRWNTQGR